MGHLCQLSLSKTVRKTFDQKLLKIVISYKLITKKGLSANYVQHFSSQNELHPLISWNPSPSSHPAGEPAFLQHRLAPGRRTTATPEVRLLSSRGHTLCIEIGLGTEVILCGCEKRDTLT